MKTRLPLPSNAKVSTTPCKKTLARQTHTGPLHGVLVSTYLLAGREWLGDVPGKHRAVAKVSKDEATVVRESHAENQSEMAAK